MTGTRSAVLAGSWYPGDPETLATEVDRYLVAVDPSTRPAGRPLLAVVPHAGYTYSGEAAGRLYGHLRQDCPRTVFILAPNHRAHLKKAALSGAQAFATPLGEVSVDTRAVRKLAECQAFVLDDSAHAGEHAVEIQLPFLQRLWQDRTPTIVPILVPALNRSQRMEAATALKDLTTDDTLLLVSTDFTHYGPTFGYVPFTADIPTSLERLDSGAILKILATDSQSLIGYGEETGITMCGLHATALALETGVPPGYEAALIDYRRSGDLEGDYSLSVSYASILITTGPDRTPHPGS
ncbi:MAG: AmmeMemoRadiSam system protein B [Gemmatimonadales bacterium]|nr:AmmeMemoRadiSam system protein B [Gemmatimonadales bacterium]